ncbi:MAG: GntR family transcriptional regulator [Gammaproteobacteria bacterium]|nr:GntR family transcriptional regulator [Gammaproteobacteria bacterium]
MRADAGINSVLTDIWNDSAPIYQQLRDRIIAMIIDGELKEGEAVPSVRQVASDFRINHLTVAKAYQELMADGLLEKRRGIGMFVLNGAQEKLLKNEQEKFLHDEFPKLLKRIRTLGISKQRIIEMISKMMQGED